MRPKSLQRRASLARLVFFLFLLLLANIPFHTGSSLPPDVSRRPDHARLMISRSPLDHAAPCSLINADRLGMSGHRPGPGPGDGRLTVALWMGAVAATTRAAAAWSGPRALAPSAPCTSAGQGRS